MKETWRPTRRFSSQLQHWPVWDRQTGQQLSVNVILYWFWSYWARSSVPPSLPGAWAVLAQVRSSVAGRSSVWPGWSRHPSPLCWRTEAGRRAGALDWRCLWTQTETSWFYWEAETSPSPTDISSFIILIPHTGLQVVTYTVHISTSLMFQLASHRHI